MKIFSLLDTQYHNFVSSVQNYLSKSLSNFKTAIGSNTVFGQIISVVANAVQNLMMYIEDALTEQNKYTAQRKRSIYGLAALSGYMPSYGKAASVNLKLDYMPYNDYNSDSMGYNVVLNNKEILTCTQNGLFYSIILPQDAIVLNPVKDASTKYITAVQGKFESQRFIGQGGQYYTINFKFMGNLDLDYLTVKVNNEVWENAASLYDMSPMGKQYTYKASANGGIDIIFGNGSHGKPINANDSIDVIYLIHDGHNGNLEYDADTQFVFNNMLNDTTGDSVDGNTLFNIGFADNDPITSGTSSESMQHVREMIGLNSRSMVLASPENYKVLINRFGFCGYNRSWADSSSMSVNSLIVKNFNAKLNNGNDYFSLTEKDFILSEDQKNSIYKYIDNSGKQMALVKYNILDPQLIKYAMYIYIKLKSNKYDKELIKSQIRLYVGDFFSNVQSDMFIPKSDIIHLLKSNIEGIDGINIYMLSDKNEEAIYKGEYTDVVYELNSLGQYVQRVEHVKLEPGENPNLGFDQHGNILLKNDSQFPVLMGGWKYYNDEKQDIQIVDPLTIMFED